MLHGLTNSFPTRRCSVLGAGDLGGTAIPAATESPSAPSTASATTGSGSTVADSAGGYVSAAVAWLSDRDRAAFEAPAAEAAWFTVRSEEHTSDLQSLMRIPYAVFCLKKKNNS